MSSTVTRTVAAVVLVIGAAAVLYHRTRDNGSAAIPAPRTKSVDIKRVVSANKLKTDSDEYVILAGVRAPYPNEPHGKDAADFVRQRVEDQTVRLRFDDQQKDEEGRWVAYVFADGEMVNEALVRDGWAFVRLKLGQTRFATELLAAQHDAQTARRGLWRARPLGDEGDYVGDRKHALFHRPACEDVPNIKPQDRVDLSDPQTAFDQGFSPCSTCAP